MDTNTHIFLLPFKYKLICKIYIYVCYLQLCMLFQFTLLSAAKLPDKWEELTGPFRPPENWVEAPEFVPVSDQ